MISANRKEGRTKKRYKGLDHPPKFVSPTVHYTYERDYTFKTSQQVSLNTLEGRITLAYQGKDSHVTLIQQGARIGEASLWYDSRKKRFYLLVSLEIEVADPTFESHKDVVGIDVGVRYLAVTSTSTGKPTWHSGKRRRHQANRVSSQWSFAELQALIAYKAVLAGSMAIKVDARNLTTRTLLLRQDWSKTGTLEVGPDASDREAKAARLSRYAELRWSPEASPSPSRGHGD
jgi:transposase